MSDMGIFFLVMRVYRCKSRVLSIHYMREPAELAYDKAVADMRDGDVILARGSLEKLKADSGGYNRTRW